MAYDGLTDFIRTLEKKGELIRVTEFVDPVLEITEITDRISKQSGGGKAILFENTGTAFPLLINALGSDKRMLTALNTSKYENISRDIETIFKSLTKPVQGFWQKIGMLPKLGKIASWMPRTVKGRGKCQEVVHHEPDLNILPILKCWPADGGRFITLPVVNTIDPITKIRNVGMYRMQQFDKNLTGMHWHRHKVGARHFEEYKKLGKKMPIAVALGGDPMYTYAATAPLPDNFDEYILAGFLRKKRVKLVKALTQDIYVPEDADIIIEGYIDPEENLIWEGAFGDHTGFYSLADWFPRFHVTCITHRQDAVYQATIVGIPPQEDAYIAKATERIFLAPIKMAMIPELVDMNIPPEGVAHNLIIAKIEKSFPGQALKVANALWGAGQMMFNKMAIIVDGTVDIFDYEELIKVLSQNIDPAKDIFFSAGPLDILDHASDKQAYGGKICIDATRAHDEELRGKSLIGNNVYDVKIDAEKLSETFAEITTVNSSFLQKGISFLIISIEKNKNTSVKTLARKLFELSEFTNIKALLIVDKELNINDLSMCIWVSLNNIDPLRDSLIIEAKDNNSIAHICIDGTRKTLEADNFQRDWPNAVISDTATIEAIDEKWASLGLGEFIESPSLKYQQLVKNKGAIVS